MTLQTPILAILIVWVACWCHSPLGADEIPRDQVQPKDLLQLFEVDNSQLRFLQDGAAVGPEETETIQRILFLLPRFDDVIISNWSTKTPDQEDLLRDPDTHRTKFFRVTGFVQNLTETELSPEAANRFGFDHFYIVDVRTTQNQLAKICVRNLPKNWPENLTETPPLPISCDAMYLKSGDSSAPSQSLIFATKRLRWHPTQPHIELGVSTGSALLASHGFDVSRFAELTQRRPLGDTDRPCFYELMSTVGKIDDNWLSRSNQSTTLDIVSALKTPTANAGQLIRLHGLARRAIRIRVDDKDIQNHFGIREYFEVELFVPLEQSLKLVDPNTQAERMYHSYPMTVCCRELPDGMPQGDYVRQPIEVDAFFLKLWSYQSRSSDANDRKQRVRQICPLLIARTVRLAKTPLTKNTVPSWSLVVIVFGTVIVAWGMSRWYRRADQRFHSYRRRSQSTTPDFDNIATPSPEADSSNES